MGERAGYRVSKNGKSMLMIRKQWFVGSNHTDLKGLVVEVANVLMTDKFGLCGDSKSLLIGGGAVALRNDLGVGRLSMALLNVLSEPPFDEVVEGDDYHCDINDHGIYEIELIDWNKWELNNYPVKYANKTDALGEKKNLATVTFEEGKDLKSGMKVDFHVPDNWEYGDE